MAMLNPYEDDSDPRNIVRGNPGLKSETEHDISAGIYRHLGMIVGQASVSFFCSIIPDAIERVTESAGGDASITTYRNVGRRVKYGISTYNAIPLDKKGTFLSFYLVYSITRYDSPDPNVGDNRSRGIEGMAIFSGKLWKGARLQADYLLTSTQNLSQSRKTDYLHSLKFEINQEIIKNRLSASVYVRNPFESRSSLRERIAGDNFRMETSREHLGRVFGFSLRFNFGRLRDRVADATPPPDDTSRKEGML